MKQDYTTNDMRNAAGYPDPTAFEAMKEVDKDYVRFKNLLHTIFAVCRLAGFEVEGRIALIDKETGRVWR